MNLKIMVDSSCGLDDKEIKALNIDVFPLHIYFDNVEYKDGVDISKEVFYNKLVNEEVFPKTSLPNLALIEDKVNEYTKNNMNVIIITLSSKISGTYSALSSLFCDNKNVKVVDSASTICGMKYLIEEAIKNSDKTLDEIVNILDDLKSRIRIVAVVSTLEYLHKGGRLSKTASISGNILGIKPVISVVDGEVKLIAKKLGKKHVINYISLTHTFDQVDNNYPVYGLYSMNKENYISLYNALEKKIQEKISNVYNISPVIGAHVGPNAYGIVYIEK